MTVGIPPLPRPASGRPDDMEIWARQLVGALEAAFAGQAAPHGTYAVTNLAAPVRAIDCGGGATAADVAEVLGTLVDDLIDAGVLTK